MFVMPGIIPKGMRTIGNIDIANRPLHRNPDGTGSTEYSTSMQDARGNEILIPTLAGGQFLTPTGEKPPEGSPEEKAMFNRAWQRYEKTGEHMGMFDNPDDADAYAQRVHERELNTSSPWAPSPTNVIKNGQQR
jgi:hypothetical protein